MLCEAQKVIFQINEEKKRINEEKIVYEKIMDIYNNKIKNLESKLEENKFAINSSRLKPKEYIEEFSFCNNNSPSRKNSDFSNQINPSVKSNLIIPMFTNIESSSEDKMREDNELLNSIDARTDKVNI